MIDRSTKIILLAIACGLWANVAAQLIRPAVADDVPWATIVDHLNAIESFTSGADKSLYRIRKGECSACGDPARDLFDRERQALSVHQGGCDQAIPAAWPDRRSTGADH
jgi:hypothetical protein